MGHSLHTRAVWADLHVEIVAFAYLIESEDGLLCALPIIGYLSQLRRELNLYKKYVVYECLPGI